MILTSRLEALIRSAVKTSGTYDPVTAVSYIEEELTTPEHKEVSEFLNWCVKSKTTFGWNLRQVWFQWRLLKKRQQRFVRSAKRRIKKSGTVVVLCKSVVCI